MTEADGDDGVEFVEGCDKANEARDVGSGWRGETCIESTVISRSFGVEGLLTWLRVGGIISQLWQCYHKRFVVGFF